MLPKPEKIKKKIKSEESETVNEISPAEKIRKKRIFVTWALSITIGLSFLFWIYHFLRNFSLPKISLSVPKISVSKNLNPTLSLEKDINSVLISEKSIWSIYIKSDSFLWQKNPDQLFSDTNPDSIISNLSKSKNTNESLIQKSLPVGAEIKENLISKNNSFEAQYLITVPQKQIFLVLKVSGDNLEKSKLLIPQLAEKIYWDVIGL
jgi:hypothetical protein